MRSLLTIIFWVLAINLVLVLSDGSHTMHYLLAGDGFVWAFLSVLTGISAFLLVLALLVSRLCRRIGLGRLWRVTLSGALCGVIVLAYNIAMLQLHAGSIAVSGLFAVAGSSVGYTVGLPKRSEI